MKAQVNRQWAKVNRQWTIDNGQCARGKMQWGIDNRQPEFGNSPTPELRRTSRQFAYANATANKPAIGNMQLAICNWQSVTGGFRNDLKNDDTAAPLSPSPPNKTRVWTVAAGHVALWTGSYIALNKAWYDGFEKSDFHFFNDNHEWNQMDKAGHTWTAYQVSRLSAGLWKWAGLNERKSAVLGGISGLAYQSIIEIQDGFSSEWGFSWGDMAANFLGAATFVSQELGWHEQRFQFKLSYWAYDYNSPELKSRRNQLFGSSLPERLLKDYNSQTYWLSANVASFLKNSKWPAWLNMAVGYSSNGMLGGFGNTWTDKQGNTFDRNDIHRERHYLLSPDIDLTKIHSNKKWVRTLLSIANMVKIPAPALGLSSKGKLKAYGLYF
jgi:hypothetical protein